MLTSDQAMLNSGYQIWLLLYLTSVTHVKVCLQLNSRLQAPDSAQNTWTSVAVGWHSTQAEADVQTPLNSKRNIQVV